MEKITSQTATVDYFKLLTIQMKNQDPMNPADQQGMISDMAQFSMLQGIEDMNKSFGQVLQLQELSQGINLMGKTVDYHYPSTNELKSGTASEIFNVNDSIKVLVNGTSIPLDSVIRVAEPKPADA